MRTKENLNRIIAQKIADALFVDNGSMKATRLQIMVTAKNGLEMRNGGWNKKAVIDQIVKVLEQ